MNAQRVARETDVGAVERAPPELRTAALAGADLRRHKNYWKVAAWRPLHAVWSEVALDTATWIAKNRARAAHRSMPARGRPATLAALSEEVAAPVLRQSPLQPSPEFLAYSAAIPRPSPTQVVVSEDKDGAAAWIADAMAYRIRCWHWLTFGAAWRRTALSCSDAAHRIRDAHTDPAILFGVNSW